MKNRGVIYLVPLFLLAVMLLAGCRSADRLAWAAEARAIPRAGWPSGRISRESDPRAEGLTHYLQGLLFDERGDWVSAEAAYRKARQADPEAVQVALRLGAVHLKKNDLPEAIGLFEFAARQDPADPQPHFLLGVLYADQQRFEEAADQYARILSQDPGHLGALSELADLYLLQEKLSEGLAVYLQLLKERPDSAVLHFNTGVLFAKTQQWPQAVEHLQRAVDLEPENLEARLGLAVSLELSGDLVGAQQAFLEALALEPVNTRLIRYLAHITYRLGEMEESAQWLSRTLSFQPRDPEATVELAAIWVEQKKGPEAARLIRETLAGPLSQDQAWAPLWLSLGWACQSGGRFSDAQDVYQAALQLFPEDPEALNALGYLYAERGIRLEEAIGLLEKALSLDPENGAYLDSLGWAYYKTGRPDRALELLREASDRMQDSEVFYHLGQVYLSLGDPMAAQAAWEQGLSLEPRDAALVQRLKSALKSLSPKRGLFRKDR